MHAVIAGALLGLAAAQGAIQTLSPPLDALCPKVAGGLHMLWTSSTYPNAAAACAARGLVPAEITTENFLAAANMAFACNGAFARAWVGSWYNVSYGPGVCLAMYTSATAGGGAIAMPVSCATPLPVICTETTPAPTIPPQCSSGPYAAIPAPNVFLPKDAEEACAAYGMTNASIEDVADPNILSALDGCFADRFDRIAYVRPVYSAFYNATSIALWEGPNNLPELAFESAEAVANYNYSVVCRAQDCLHMQINAVDVAADIDSMAIGAAAPNPYPQCTVNDLTVVPIFGAYDQAEKVCLDVGMALASINATEFLALSPILAKPECADQSVYSFDRTAGAWIAGARTPPLLRHCAYYYPGGLYVLAEASCNEKTHVLCERVNPV